MRSKGSCCILAFRTLAGRVISWTDKRENRHSCVKNSFGESLPKRENALPGMRLQVASFGRLKLLPPCSYTKTLFWPLDSALGGFDCDWFAAGLRALAGF